MLNKPVSRGTGVLRSLVSGAAAACLLLVASACGLPYVTSLDEQKAMVQRNELRFLTLTSRAFLETWGPATYEHRELTQFFPVANGNYIPRFRVPVGEPPPGWHDAAVAGEGYFLGYVDRGELLGFLDDRLVYRERMSAEQLRAIGKMWQYESQFKTGLESGTALPSVKP